MIEFLYKWQTLLGAAVALPFAFFAILFPVLQERNRRARHFAAMRASLPLRLSMVNEYATAAMVRLGTVRLRNEISQAARASFEKPEIPDNLVDGLERTIEATNNRRVIRRLSDMIGEIQVLDSRLTAFSAENKTTYEVDSYLIQSATIHAQADSIYDFARRRKNQIQARLEWGDIRRALFLSRIYDTRFPGVYEVIGRYERRRLNPERNDPRPSRSMRVRMWIAVKKEKFGEWREARRNKAARS